MSNFVERRRRQFSDARPAKRAGLILLLLAGSLVVGPSAWAYWKSTGSGSGSATTGTMTFQVVALIGGDTTGAVSAQSSTLVPGSSASALLRVTNPNAFAVKVIAISAAAATAPGTCDPSNVHFTNPIDYTTPPTAAQYSLLANATSLLTLPNAVHMDSGAPQNCMGATFTFPVTVTVQK